MAIKRFASGSGYGCSASELMTVNRAVFAPIPSASARTADSARPGFRNKERTITWILGIQFDSSCRGGLRPRKILPQRQQVHNGQQRSPEFGCIPAPRTNMVHNGVMRTGKKALRQSVSLPPNVAAQVRNLAKTRRLSANRMLVELIENGMEAEKRKQQEFFELAERFRNATDPKEAERLGDELGRMVFGR